MGLGDDPSGDMALRCYTCGLRKDMMAMKKTTPQNLEHLQKELLHEQNLAKSLREVWVNNKKGLRRVGEMTEQLLRMQKVLNQNEDQIEGLEKLLDEQRELVRIISD